MTPASRSARYAVRAALAVVTGMSVVAGLPSSAHGPVAESVPAVSPVAESGVASADRRHGWSADEGVPSTDRRHGWSADEGDPRAAVERLRELAASPLVGVAALPLTELEREEPERLYALVTREQAVEPLRYAPEDLELLPGDFYKARAEVVDQLAALLEAADDEGHPLVVTSGFRDHDTQAGTHEDWVRRAGAAAADRLSARPGHSEHQLGLAVDLAGTCSYQCFGDTVEGRWVADNAHRWGFIIRYPEGGEEVTGYAAEPWHLRYVGPRAAWAMHLRDEPHWDDFAPLLLDQR